MPEFGIEKLSRKVLTLLNITPRHNPKSQLRQAHCGERLSLHTESGCSKAECCELETSSNIVGTCRTLQECG